MSQDHRPRTATREMMIDIVAQSQEPLTRTQIVNRLNRKKTPHLIDMMDAMVDQGIFNRSIVTFHNGVTGYVYSAAGSHTSIREASQAQTENIGLA